MLRSLFRSLRAGPQPADATVIANGEVTSLLTAGAAEQRAGNIRQAEALYKKALEHAPRNPGAMYLLGTLCLHRRDFDQAELWLRAALEVMPNSAHVLNSLGSTLMATGRQQEARSCLEAAVQADPVEIRPFANLLFLMNLLPGISREEAFALHRRWADIHGNRPKVRQGNGWSSGQSGGASDSGRLRVGYVSADFYEHPVGRIICGILREHDFSSMQIHCYDSGSEDDSVHRRCRASGAVWHDVAALSDEQLAEKISDDGIHVLVDLSGHTRNGRLGTFARKPAPVQMSWLGYLNTTGLTEMDWRITEKMADPMPESQRWHTERLLYLPYCLWPCLPPSTEPVSPLPCDSNGVVTFGSFNTFRKVNRKILEVWSGILEAVPGARMQLYGVPVGRTVDWIYDMFEAHGTDLSRINVTTTMAYDRYLQAYSQVDIALDTFPYSGGATTWEALWMGVPVVTLCGNGGFSSTSASLLSAAGHGDWIAGSVDEYVRIAAGLARDVRRLRTARNELRADLLASRLTDVKEFTRNLERAYRIAWHMQGDSKNREPVELSPC